MVITPIKGEGHQAGVGDCYRDSSLLTSRKNSSVF